MAVHTYVVNHGGNDPKITGNFKILGGDLESFSVGDMIEKLNIENAQGFADKTSKLTELINRMKLLTDLNEMSLILSEYE